MAKTLKTMLEVYRPKSKDEQKFIDKHVVHKTQDANGNKDDVFTGSNVKAIDRKKEDHGYNVGEDEKVYEEVESADSDLVTALLELYAACDDEERQELLAIVEEGRLEEFLDHLVEEMDKEESND